MGNNGILLHGTSSSSAQRADEEDNMLLTESTNLKKTSSAAANPLAEFEPPLTSLNRIVRASLPDNVQFGKEVKLAFQRSAGIFIMYLTACAKEFSKENKRQTILPEDIFKALEELDFDDFVDPLKTYYSRLKDEKNNEKSSVRSGNKNSKMITPSSIATVSSDLSNQINENITGNQISGKDCNHNDNKNIQLDIDNDQSNSMIEEGDNDDVNINNSISNIGTMEENRTNDDNKDSDGVPKHMETTIDNIQNSKKDKDEINNSVGFPQSVVVSREKRKREENDEDEDEDVTERQEDIDNVGLETIETEDSIKAE